MAAKKTKKKGGRSKPKAAGPGSLGLTVEQQRDVLAVGLVALALLVSLALVPVGALGSRGAEWFPSGNLMGPIGRGTAGAVTSFLGVTAFLAPLSICCAGFWSGGWVHLQWARRLTLFGAGLLVMAPALIHILGPDGAGGWLGGALAGPLTSVLGWLGATLLLGALLVVLSVSALGWNPLRTVGRGAVVGGAWVGRGVGDAAQVVRRWWGERPRRSEVVDREPPRDETPRETSQESAAGDAAGSPGAEPDAASSAEDPPEISWESLQAESEATLPDPRRGRTPEVQELPDLDLLQPAEGEGKRDMEAELDRLGQVLVEKLRTFNVESRLGGRTTGPVVTQFEVVPAAGVKVNRIANLDADLALAMRAPSVRIVAPIPGKGAVGVEIPNPQPAIVRLRGILEGRDFQGGHGQLPLALGEDLTGRPYVSDLAKMPHLLIAGATGSGKSVCVNTIVTSLVYRHTPETLRLLMVDPKMVELSAYADLPHLRHPVVTDPSEAAGVLRWAVMEMERRYRLLSANGVRSIAEFNQRLSGGGVMKRLRPGGAQPEDDDPPYDEGLLPYIVVVVEELADLMMQVQSEVERPLAQLAQKARAIGIHLIVATQRPSVNVITGLIKANFPTRIACRVASKTDSRTILDQNGAEALLGNGDMLFLPPGQSEPVRLQGAYIATEETDRLISWFRAQEAHRLEREEESARIEAREMDILAELRARETEESSGVVDEIAGDWDELFRAAAEVCIQNAQGSTSLLQRKLRIGYGRAARIVDQLHDAGVLGPPDGSKPREVLFSLDDLDAMFP